MSMETIQIVIKLVVPKLSQIYEVPICKVGGNSSRWAGCDSVSGQRQLIFLPGCLPSLLNTIWHLLWISFPMQMYMLGCVCVCVCTILLFSLIWYIPLKLQIVTPAEIIILGQVKSDKGQKLKLNKLKVLIHSPLPLRYSKIRAGIIDRMPYIH